MKNSWIIPVALIGIFLLSNKTDKRKNLISWISQGGDSQETKNKVSSTIMQMSDSEVDIVYSFVFDYLTKGIKVPPGAFATALNAISLKYGIFT